MRPDFWFGVAIVLGGLSIMAYGAWPRKQTPEFKTLAIWSADNGVGAIQWFDGVLDRKDIETIVGIPGLRLSEVLTVQGRQVDPTWARSIQR